MPYHTISEIARRLGIPPRAISDMFYARRLDDARCPVISGRRLVPVDYLPAIEKALRDSGKLQPT
jgi:hypothetical protein